MARYEFRVKGPKQKCVKIFFTAEEVKSLMARVLTRFPSLHGKELSSKFADTNDGIELPADDPDSFIDMIDKTKGKTLTRLNSKCAN